MQTGVEFTLLFSQQAVFGLTNRNIKPLHVHSENNGAMLTANSYASLVPRVSARSLLEELVI
jgi:hypothetical protein